MGSLVFTKMVIVIYKYFTVVPLKAATNNDSCWLGGDLVGWGWGVSGSIIGQRPSPVARDLDMTQHSTNYFTVTPTPQQNSF